LVVANKGDNSVSVLLGNGDGSFDFLDNDPTEGSFLVGSSPRAVAVGDVNGDGVLDLVAVNEGDDNVGVLLGNGDGSFQTQSTFAVGSRPEAVALADLNGDGVLDLVVANKYDNSVSVLLGNGAGGFHYVNNDPTEGTFGVRSSPRAVTAADVNGDGRP